MKVVKVQIPNCEKIEDVLSESDIFYGEIHIADDHFQAWDGEMFLKDRDALKERVEKLEAELTEIKTARTLREAYVTGIEKGCESLREERDRWKRRFTSAVTDIEKSLSSNGIEFKLKEIHGDGNWDVVIDIPELNEAKKKVEDLEKKLAAYEKEER